MPITVSLIEDNAAMREGFALLINEAPSLRCLATYATAEEGLQRLPTQTPDVVLMDINLPGMSGIACVERLKAKLPKLQVLMLTRFEQSDSIFQALRAGASGYLVKSASPSEIVQAIEQVHAGGVPMSMQIARKVIAHFQGRPKPSLDIESLTAREMEVVQLLARGQPYKNIADSLGISVNTLRSHIRTTYEKLHVHTRAEAMLKLLDHNEPPATKP
jgi:DNA-binding NarL/FixJ family response regulator